MMALVILHVLFSYQKSSEQATEITNGARLSHQSWRIFPRVVSRQMSQIFQGPRKPPRRSPIN